MISTEDQLRSVMSFFPSAIILPIADTEIDIGDCAHLLTYREFYDEEPPIPPVITGTGVSRPIAYGVAYSTAFYSGRNRHITD